MKTNVLFRVYKKVAVNKKNISRCNNDCLTAKFRNASV